MTKIAIIIGSISDRQGLKVARWMEKNLSTGITLYFSSILELKLPLLDKIYKRMSNPSEMLQSLRNQIKEAEGYFQLLWNTIELLKVK
jgi:NAD(P)H-dependent FMN reductase